MGEILKVTSSLVGADSKNKINSQTWLASLNQSLFTLSNGKYNLGKKQLEVYIQGIKQVSGVNFIETSSTSFTITEGLPMGTLVEAKWVESIVPSVPSHSDTHKLGGQDELSVDTLKNYKELAKDRIDQLNTNVGSVTSLTTTNKSSLVDAINEQLSIINNKAEQIYTDTIINNIAKGSLKETYSTLSALQTALPTGAVGLYLVLADNKVYYWNGTIWVAGPFYQTMLTADNSINYAKTDFLTTGKNLYDAVNATVNGLDHVTGLPITDSTFILTPFMVAIPGKRLYASISDGNSRITYNFLHKIAFYDTNKAFLSATVPSLSLNPGAIYSGTSSYMSIITIPANAVYMRATFPTSFQNSQVQLEYDARTDTFEAFNYKLPSLDLNSTYQSLQATVDSHTTSLASLNSNYASKQGVSVEQQARIDADNAHANASIAHQATQIAYDGSNNMKQKMDATQTQLNTMTSGATPNGAEVIDARLGADGVVRSSLGAFVREIQAQQLDATTQSSALSHGVINVVNTNNAASANATIFGKSLVNILGYNGGMEDYPYGEASGGSTGGVPRGWRSIGVPSNYNFSSSYSQLTSGKKSFKCVRASTSGNIIGIAHDVLSSVVNGKYYVFAGDIYNPSSNSVYFAAATSGGYASIITSATINTNAGFTTYYKKFQYTGQAQLDISLLYLSAGTVGDTFYADSIRLYEVDAATYAKIDVDPEFSGSKFIEKIPYVEAVKHLQAPLIRKVGKNLLPPFVEWTSLHSNAIATEQYRIELNATADYQSSYVEIKAIPSQTYTVSRDDSSTVRSDIRFLDASGNQLTRTDFSTPLTVTSPSTASKVRIYFDSNVLRGTLIFKNPQLEIGSSATPFEPYNVDYIALPTILASNTDDTIRDMIYERDGQWYKLKRWVTDVQIDGATPYNWSLGAVYTGTKRFKMVATPYSYVGADLTKVRITKNNGKPLVGITGGFFGGEPADLFNLNGTDTNVIVSNIDSGMDDAFTPIAQEIKNYFNGWRMNNGNTSNLYPGTGTKYWTPIVSPRANFVGKITGSTVENPHTAKNRTTSTVLILPSDGNAGEFSYTNIQTTDGIYVGITSSANGQIPQQIFSFNLIEHVLRKYGVAIFGSAGTIAERVAWLRTNTSKIACNWYGYGVGPAGNKATVQRWNYVTSAWNGNNVSTSSTTAKVSVTPIISDGTIDTNGFVYFLAYADASDGITASWIYTDYVDLEVELNVTTVPSTGYSSVEYTPYMLDYVLTNSTEDLVKDAEGGAIALTQGANSIEVSEGVIVREKITPKISNDGTTYGINHVSYSFYVEDAPLKNRAATILSVYKNGVIDPSWTIMNSAAFAYGTARATIKTTNYDLTAEYTVTYRVLDKNAYTVNVVDTKIEYKSTAKGIQNDTSQRISDAESKIGAIAQSIAELYKKMKSLGG